MGPDIDLQESGILGAWEVVEGLATLRAAALIGRKEVVLEDGRKVRNDCGVWDQACPAAARVAMAAACSMERAGVGGAVAAAVSDLRPKSWTCV